MQIVSVLKSRLLKSVSMVACVATLLVGCTPRVTVNKELFMANHPRTILVLPVLNETPTVDADGYVLAEVPRHLLNLGYYVIDPVLTKNYLLSEGAPTAEDIYNIDLQKLGEIFGADAVLYTDLTEWDTSYLVVSTNTAIEVRYKLVDTQTREVLWEDSRRLRDGSGSGGNAVAMLASALVSAVGSQIERHGYERALLRRANSQLFYSRVQGPLYGPYHPQYQQDYEWE